MEQFQSQRGADAVTLVYTCHGTICRKEPATTNTLLMVIAETDGLAVMLDLLCGGKRGDCCGSS